MPLTDTAARQAKPRPKSYRLADGHGLYLEVVPSGSRYWRLKYRFADKEKRLAIGVYPIVSLAKARQVATEARSLLMDGIDPSVKKRERKRELKRAAANSFEAVAREWHTTMSPKWTPHHADDVIESLEKDIFPALGQRPIVDLKAPELLDAIRKIEKRGAIDIAQRVRQRCSAIFAYAIGSGFVENNPITGMKGIFVTRKKEPRRMLPRAELPEFLRKLEGHKGDRMVQLALRLVILTMVRTVELRGARWQEFDFESNLWSIPAERIKTRAPHVVPLSRQAVAALNELNRLRVTTSCHFRAALITESRSAKIRCSTRSTAWDTIDAQRRMASVLLRPPSSTKAANGARMRLSASSPTGSAMQSGQPITAPNIWTSELG